MRVMRELFVVTEDGATEEGVYSRTGISTACEGVEGLIVQVIVGGGAGEFITMLFSFSLAASRAASTAALAASLAASR